MNMKLLSTSIYDLVLIYVCHFHQLLLQSLFKFDHYRDTRAFILDPCIQGIFDFLLLTIQHFVKLINAKMATSYYLIIDWFFKPVCNLYAFIIN